MNKGNDSIDLRLRTLLQTMIRNESSDLHLVPGYPAVYRVHGRLAGSTGDVLEPETIEEMIATILPPGSADRIHESRNLDCSVALGDSDEGQRFRANIFFAQGQLCACFRHIPPRIPTLDWMGFPPGLAQRIAHLTNGLVVITGVTGSGKSTTLAALVEMLNTEGGYRIITVEEPIEYVFSRTHGSVVTQREVGADVESFPDGLKYGLRQDPDVVLVGEIRDRETAQMALSAAETGHLILTTLHTQDAKGAITRLTDLFPPEIQDDVRTQLALSLRFVIAQHLLPSAKPNAKRELALEVLVANHAVRSAIRTGKIQSIESAIQTGKKDGMTSLDESLQQLVSQGRIAPETGLRFAKDPQGFGA